MLYGFAAYLARRGFGGIQIAGITEKPLGFPLSSSSRTAKMALFMQMGVPNYVALVSSSDIPSMPTKKFLDENGKEHSGLCAEEMVEIVLGYRRWRKLNGFKEDDFVLVMDNDPSHAAALFKETMGNLKVHFEYLPPRSHDLSPPDSYMFGVAKSKWCQRVQSEFITNWDQRARLLFELLERLNPDAHIASYRLKLQCCIDANGDRFKEQYEKRSRENKRKA